MIVSITLKDLYEKMPTVLTDEWCDSLLSRCKIVPSLSTIELDELIKTHSGLVISNVNKVWHPYLGFSSGIDFEDLVQEGNIGLIHAIERYDDTLGYQFSTYATWWIRQSIFRFLANHARMIRLPVHVSENVKKLWKLEANGSSDEEIMKNLEIDENKLVALRSFAPDSISLDGKIVQSDDDSSTFFDLVEDPAQDTEKKVLNSILKEKFLAVMKKVLNQRQYEVVSLRFGLVDDVPRTLEEIAGVYGLTRERIRQIEASALLKLRRNREVKPFGPGA